MFNRSEVWRKLNSRRRREILKSLEVTTAQWCHFRLPATVTRAAVHSFAERNLLRGFFERSSKIISAITIKPAAAGIELGIALSPPAPNVPLPCWGTSFKKAMEISFPGIKPMPTGVIAQQE
jgi:hypothetical protein